MAQFEICITEKGRQLLAESVSGNPLTFQSMVLGDGGYGGDLSKVEEMISPKLTLEVGSVERRENQVSIQSVITPGMEVSPFYWREVGIYAKDPEGGADILAVYGNAGEKADYLSGTGGILDEKIINITILVEPDEVVTDFSGVLFATRKELSDHAEDASLHTQVLTHQKSGTVHQFTGLSEVEGTVSAVFTATAGFAAGDTVAVDGTPYTIQLSNGETAEDNLFVSGASVPIVLDTAEKKVNFKAGGGLTVSKLALATALASDVVEGKTFYAGDKMLKTGTRSAYKIAVGHCNLNNVTSVGETLVSISGIGFRPSLCFAFHEQTSQGYCPFWLFTSGEGLVNHKRALLYVTDNSSQELNLTVTDDGFILTKAESETSHVDPSASYIYFAIGI